MISHAILQRRSQEEGGEGGSCLYEKFKISTLVVGQSWLDWGGVRMEG